MAKLQNRLATLIPEWREETRALVTEHGAKTISEVNVQQAYGGMRGVKAMICDTSEVPPDVGLLIRGTPIGELADKTPEDIFYLLCTGELPNARDRKALSEELAARAKVPAYVWKVLEAMPSNSHPMAMLDTAILAMERESKFRAAYDKGMPKEDYWKPMLEDSLDLLAMMPTLAAGVYRMRFKKGPRIAPKKDLTWSQNYARMLGIKDKSGEFADCMRLYLVLHCDHEGGNVSAHTCHLVGSALSDAYYSVSAGLNGLAGPLHGLANQECLNWIIELNKRFKGKPSQEDIRKVAWDTLNSGKVIPGYGHAVLRVSDPRFTEFRAFGMKHFPDDPIMKTVNNVFEVVPQVLMEQGKAKNPWPNVDAGSGALLYHYGLKEFSYYTVLFSVSRAMGMLSQLIVNRALGAPIERPKSVTTKWVKKQVGMK
ncbi:MAG TPA: citrate (Si)-synthase [Candidatus Krumholzibacteria bacterium]|nr:citrate (Si)-synthase [Candidatus Krumholzibacteria bacterium]HRX52618.1 citrate (Si)-synthase [Candidatus Krumholzibacteria bacterium]